MADPDIRTTFVRVCDHAVCSRHLFTPFQLSAPAIQLCLDTSVVVDVISLENPPGEAVETSVSPSSKNLMIK